MSRTERLLAVGAVLLVFVYVLLRAILVSTNHDEAATFFHYVVTERVVPFYNAHWDANNHFLNSALSLVCYKLLGPAQWSIRLPNVLSFLLYGFFSIRIAAQLRSKLIRWMVLIALLTAAFPLEFFSIARGYAMSLAFMLGALYHGGAYLKTREFKQQVFTWCWLWLAIAANLTLTNTYLIVLGLVGITLFRVRKRWFKHGIALVVFGLPGVVMAVIVGLELKNRGLLYTGLPDGFIEVTVRSLVRYQLDMESATLANFMTFIGGTSAIFLIARLIISSLQWNTFRLAAVLLLLNAIASISLNLIFGLNFPENRVGMYYIPLFMVTLAGALDEWTVSQPKVQWLSLCFLFFPAHLVKHFNFGTTILWPRWHASEGLYEAAKSYQYEQGETQTLSAEYLNELGWAYYNFQNNAEMQLLQRDPVPDTLADLMIARPVEFDFATIPYEPIFHDEPNNVYLLKRKQDLKWTDSVNPEPSRRTLSGSNEFYELLNGSVKNLPDHIGTLELKGVFTSQNGLFDGQLVITSSAPDGGTYNMIPLHWIRPSWNQDTLHVKRTYHFPEDATDFKIYFWNLHRDSISFELDELTFRSPK